MIAVVFRLNSSHSKTNVSLLAAKEKKITVVIIVVIAHMTRTH